MIRKFNYTERKKLTRDSVEIIINTEKRSKQLDANIKISDSEYPDDAKIYIEAYYKTNYMRFDFGTISQVRVPNDRLLKDFLNTDLIYFRIKIVDESKKIGMILAMLSGLQADNSEDINPDRQAILAVNYNADLGQKLYQLEFNEIEKFPILEINKQLENQSELVRSSIFISTIYPSVIREIAREIIFDKDYWEEEDDNWQGQWLKYYRIGLKINTPRPKLTDEYELKCEWIEDIVSAYCNKYRVRNLFSSLSIS